LCSHNLECVQVAAAVVHYAAPRSTRPAPPRWRRARRVYQYHQKPCCARPQRFGHNDRRLGWLIKRTVRSLWVGGGAEVKGLRGASCPALSLSSPRHRHVHRRSSLRAATTDDMKPTDVSRRAARGGRVHGARWSRVRGGLGRRGFERTRPWRAGSLTKTIFPVATGCKTFVELRASFAFTHAGRSHADGYYRPDFKQ
jgi:hypothetical protein